MLIADRLTLVVTQIQTMAACYCPGMEILLPERLYPELPELQRTEWSSRLASLLATANSKINACVGIWIHAAGYRQLRRLYDRENMLFVRGFPFFGSNRCQAYRRVPSRSHVTHHEAFSRAYECTSVMLNLAKNVSYNTSQEGTLLRYVLQGTLSKAHRIDYQLAASERLGIVTDCHRVGT